MYGFSIERVEGSPLVLKVGGELDMATADEFEGALEEALSADPALVVDMADVTFCDAAGLRVILRTAESLNGAGPLTLINAPRVAWLLGLVGLAGLPSIDVRGGR
jgi:anti-anti-sigma factor